MRYVTLLITLLIISISYHATAQHYRLKKLETFEYLSNTTGADFEKIDSAIYYYSNGRGGFYTSMALNQSLRPYTQIRNHQLFYELVNYMQYDSVIRYKPRQLGYIHATYQQFDILNNIIYRISKVGVLGGKSVTWDSAVYNYNGSLLMHSLIKKLTNPVTYNYYKYNFLKLPDTVFHDNGDPYIIYTYNSKNLLEQVLVLGKGKTNSERKTYYYNSTNMIDSILAEHHPWGVWEKRSVNAYTYNTAGQPITETVYYYTKPAGIPIRHTSQLFTTYYGKLGRVDSMYFQMYSGTGWGNVMRYRYYYNLIKYPDSLILDQWDGTKWANVHDTISYTNCNKHHFTYEQYFPTNISSKNKLDVQITMYPNPATDFLFVRADLKNRQPYTIRVTDMNGRLLKAWDEPATTTVQKQIPVAELPPGAYLLHLHTEDAEATETFMISK